MEEYELEPVKVRLSSLSNEDSSYEEEASGKGFHTSLDRAFKMAGEFGVFQKRFFVFVTVYQVVAVFHVLGITFVGLEPDWECAESIQDSSNLSADTSRVDKCTLYEGSANSSLQLCLPQYTERFHSIAQEVKLSN